MMEIMHTDNGKKGRFFACDNKEEMGEMTYRWSNDYEIIIDHTGVNPSYEGQGVGKALFMQAVGFARERNLHIIPVCPFVKVMFRRFPETGDVLIK